MNIPNELKYTKEHEWARLEGDVVTVGITDFAQGELGDIVFVELPDAGRSLVAGESFGVAESVKTVSDLYAPVAGAVTAVNDGLNDNPAAVNKDPYGAGWMVKIRVADPAALAGLLDAAAYRSLVKG
ncbi:MAG: glycine cleavage system protein GcvH [Nitrospinae bacterium]|nr:glycine cleavage system protein GcvH [Nitrospinota bacterium]